MLPPHPPPFKMSPTSIEQLSAKLNSFHYNYKTHWYSLTERIKHALSAKHNKYHLKSLEYEPPPRWYAIKNSIPFLCAEQRFTLAPGVPTHKGNAAQPVFGVFDLPLSRSDTTNVNFICTVPPVGRVFFIWPFVRIEWQAQWRTDTRREYEFGMHQHLINAKMKAKIPHELNFSYWNTHTHKDKKRHILTDTVTFITRAGLLVWYRVIFVHSHKQQYFISDFHISFSLSSRTPNSRKCKSTKPDVRESNRVSLDCHHKPL